MGSKIFRIDYTIPKEYSSLKNILVKFFEKYSAKKISSEASIINRRSSNDYRNDINLVKLDYAMCMVEKSGFLLKEEDIVYSI